MINFERFELANGLRVIVHQDKTTPMVAFNLLYDVGAKDESSSKTGFAHLFEHLMF
jgi:zinc protease